MSYLYIGKTVERQDAEAKVTGKARYTDDLVDPGTLHAALLTSTRAHARILAIDTSEAKRLPGIRAVVTGEDFPLLTGSPLEDWPLLAHQVVRYAGEPVALVVADELHQAQAATTAIEVTYADLPIVGSPRHAASRAAPLLHPALGSYRHIDEAYPVPGTNIANHTKIRKGDIAKAWSQCDVSVSIEVSFPQSHHAAMETHVATAEVLPDGYLEITTTSQSPYALQEMVEQVFGYHRSKVIVYTPLVGGGFGGKAPSYWELLVVAGSIAANGRKVHLRATREQNMLTLPGHIGLEAKIHLGAKQSGEFVAAEITFWFDGGAYSNRGLIVTRAAATDCTGPYRIPNVWCDSYCMYTNHPPTTAYRGFGHPEATFAMERAIEELADKLGVDGLTLRRINAILPGDTTPTQAVLTPSSVGDVPGCIHHLQSLMQQETPSTDGAPNLVRAWGVACIWKNSSSPPDASSGAIVKVERDGMVTVLSGAVEIGQGTKTGLAQMVAEVFKMPVDRVRVVLPVQTDVTPEHWKTVASRTTLLAGNATVRAATDAVNQLRQTAAIVLGSNLDDVQVQGGFAFRARSTERIPIGDLSHGYAFPDGRTVGRQVIGVGSYIIEGVQPIDHETGKGVTGPEWAVGAQAVQVELNPVDYTYRVLTAISVIDCGQVIHPALARGQIVGGMNMGLSLASREGYVYSQRGAITNPRFRTYPIHRYGDQPEYKVAFLETPHDDAPFGLRGIGEHGLIGMPAALANALSHATASPINVMPMTSEALWQIAHDRGARE